MDTNYPYNQIQEVSWADIHTLTKELCEILRRIKGIDNIKDYQLITIERGGLIPATIASHVLDIPFQRIVRRRQIGLSYYGSGDSNLIVIDDVCDRGTTFSNLRHAYPNATYAALFTKPIGDPSAHITIRTVSQDTWLKLPWEERI
jgi:adenine/guanine phosphoribosyltransferase-like PRPP-binding protein